MLFDITVPEKIGPDWESWDIRRLAKSLLPYAFLRDRWKDHINSVPEEIALLLTLEERKGCMLAFGHHDRTGYFILTLANPLSVYWLGGDDPDFPKGHYFTYRRQIA